MIPATDVPFSPGWYFKVLFNQLSDPIRRRRLQGLYNYRIGEAPLPRGAENAREAFQALMNMARTNFADLITGALSERIRVTGFRDASDNDQTGNADLASLWKRAGLNVISGDVHKDMLSLSESYIVVGEVDEDTDAAVVTGEDPRYMIGMPDPDRPRKLIAALKIKHFVEDDTDRVYLYLAGKVFAPGARAQVWVAKRKSPLRMGPVMGFHDREWDWEPARSGELVHDRIPVVMFRNADGMGEYEQHTDLLDRINHQILQRMTVAVFQAFRQKAVSGLPLVYPKGHPQEGKEIDYTGVFVSDPAAVWQLPKEATMWESQNADLTPIISAVSADVQHLASATRTPLHMMMPAGQNQSAEGASLQREGLMFKARDRIERILYPWSQTVRLMLMQAGVTDKTLLARLEPILASPELLSLAERASAAAQAQNDIPRKSRLSLIWQFDPDTVERMETEWTEERLLQQQMAMAMAAMNPPAPPGQQQPGQQQPGQQQQPAAGDPGSDPQQQGQQQQGQQPPPRRRPAPAAA